MHFFGSFLLFSIITLSASQRLPTNVIPISYKIQVLTHLDGPSQFNFFGKATIQVQCTEDTQNITLHSKGLDINDKDIKIFDIKNNKNIIVTTAELKLLEEFLIINLNEHLQKGQKYQIEIPYKAVLADGLRGFYRTSYLDIKTKEKKWAAVTQFEPTDARRAFPCFDEPSMKATFEIILGRKNNLTSLSNMPLAETIPIKEIEGFYWDKYKPSVPMSTYLVAFFISDFAFLTSEVTTSNNVTFKIWARKSALEQVHFAAEVGPKALEFFENFFNVPYPLPKQDMIAVPDFSAGAMENWGLITYRETALLYDPKFSSLGNRKRIASVIAHELAHQWFGNLVTMKWWSDLWLNEGFATYMGNLCTDRLFPQWNYEEEQTVSNFMSVSSFDALRSSHPIVVPIKNPNNVNEIFDAISYKKGSFLLRMMSLFLGEETLRQGVSNYLQKYKYHNADQDNLWEALTTEAHKRRILPSNLTVKTVMDSWTLQTGYPIIKVIRNYEENTAELSQERYIKDAIRSKSEQGSWWFPLSYTDGQEKAFNYSNPKLWLSEEDKTLTIDNLPDSKTWIIFNIKAAGLCKINYDEHNWRLISRELQGNNHTVFPTMNKIQLIDDAFDLSWTGELNYDILFDLLKYLSHEDKYLPWKTALSNVESILRQLKKSSIYGAFKNYMNELIVPIYTKLNGLTLPDPRSTPSDLIDFQVLISDYACRLGIAQCVSQAKELFKKLQKNPSDKSLIPNDLRETIYCTALEAGGEKEWDFLWHQYKKTNLASEKTTILSALGCTKEIWLLQRYLELSISEDSGIRMQDSFYAFGSVVRNNVGYYVAKSFFYTHINAIYKSLSDSTSKISRFLSSLSRYVINEADFQEFSTFIKQNQEYIKQVKQGADQALEVAKLNVQWQQRHFENIRNFFEKYTKTATVE